MTEKQISSKKEVTTYSGDKYAAYREATKTEKEKPKNLLQTAKKLIFFLNV